MKIAICDDNQAFSHHLYYRLVDYFTQIDKPCQCEIFTTPSSLIAADLSTTHVIFLDVDMPDMNGIDVARELRVTYPDIFIVFVTGWIKYAPAGYCVNAFRYLLKQRLNEELDQCIDDIRNKIAQSQEQIQLQGREWPVEIALNNIIYFEGSAYRMVQLHTLDGRTIECRGKLLELEEALRNKGFLRIQKSFIVNMHHILQIRNYKAYLRDGTTLKTSEPNYSEICNQYLIWKGQQL